MRKYLILLLFFLFSCEKDFIDEGGVSIPREDRIFAVTQSSVVDNQTIFFNIESDGEHTLAIKDLETNSILSKETFLPKNGIGMNDKILYIKSLPTKKLQLQLILGGEIIKSTLIIVE
jgi:hypothetical protein